MFGLNIHNGPSPLPLFTDLRTYNEGNVWDCNCWSSDLAVAVSRDDLGMIKDGFEEMGLVLYLPGYQGCGEPAWIVWMLNRLLRGPGLSVQQWGGIRPERARLGRLDTLNFKIAQASFAVNKGVAI